ncbi:hypothetical protein SUDANB19_03232 [Streptomyces sp. enrichment culture]
MFRAPRTVAHAVHGCTVDHGSGPARRTPPAPRTATRCGARTGARTAPREPPRTTARPRRTGVRNRDAETPPPPAHGRAGNPAPQPHPSTGPRPAAPPRCGPRPDRPHPCKSHSATGSPRRPPPAAHNRCGALDASPRTAPTTRPARPLHRSDRRKRPARGVTAGRSSRPLTTPRRTVRTAAPHPGRTGARRAVGGEGDGPYRGFGRHRQEGWNRAFHRASAAVPDCRGPLSAHPFRRGCGAGPAGLPRRPGREARSVLPARTAARGE